MVISDVIRLVAKEFASIAKQEGYTSFQEMSRSYDWDASDIRSEIEYAATYVCNADYNKFIDLGKYPREYKGVTVYDDTSLSDDSSEMSYKEFKKQVVAEVNKLL